MNQRQDKALAILGIYTILSKYTEKVDSRGTVKHLLLYCDSCPGQNKIQCDKID